MDETNVPVMEPNVGRSKGSRKFVWVVVGILAFMLVLVVAAIVLFRMSVGVYYLPSEAMAPTLLVHDHVTVSKLAYLSEEPKHGDLVVFNAPVAAVGTKGAVFIKRVVGVPGDRIRIAGRYIQINDTKYKAYRIRDLIGGLSMQSDCVTSNCKPKMSPCRKRF